MDFAHEYGLMVAIVLPVAIVAALNLILAMSGETGTLLLPSLSGFPSVDSRVDAGSPSRAALVAGVEAANQEDFRETA